MTETLALLLISVALFLGFRVLQRHLGAKQDAPLLRAQPGTQNVTASLRDKVLSMDPAELGLSPAGDRPNVWGVLMEMGLPEGSATLISFADGTTSLYLSTGGGIIGGGQHPSVREKAEAFLQAAELALPGLTPTRDYPPPQTGYLRFYALTFSGVRTAGCLQTEAESSSNKLFHLISAGNNVLTRLRLIQEDRPTD